MSLFNDISCDTKGNKEECVANAKVVTILAKKFGIGQWSFIGPGSDKKWYSMEENSHKEFGIILRTKCCWNSQKADILFSAQQLHCPGEVKSRGHGKLLPIRKLLSFFSHNCFCQSAQSLRSSSKHVCRIRIPSR